MSTAASLSPVTVARAQLLDRMSFVGVPWFALASAFVVNVVIFGLLRSDGASDDDAVTGGVLSIVACMLYLGVASVAQTLSLSQLLSATRRTFYLGTLTTGVVLSLINGLLLAILATLEPVTGGWGIEMTFFRYPWIADGGFFSVWLVFSAFLLLAYAIGLIFAVNYRRWGVIGSWLLTLGSAAVATVVIALLVEVPGLATATVDAFAAITPGGVGALAIAFAALLAGISWLMLRRAPAR